ncbi:MAG: DNA-binding transcriptional regulator [Verrucomicrobia bacterium]|nr:DNA-binding transcriptional regulator [Verrucomicrobiota bacterium]MDE3099406.1 DNA-binding transcriptional regulator [Verrucomicrobiota bacterium]
MKKKTDLDRPRVALLIESSRAYGRRTLFGVARYVREHRPWSIFLQERSLGDVCPAWLKDWRGDGIIARVENRQIANGIQRLGMPVVDVRYLLKNLAMPSVRPDDAAAARLAFEHLRERGFHQFAFCGFNGADYSDVRRDSFCACAAAAGMTCDVYEDPVRLPRATTQQHEARGLKDGEHVSRWLQKLPKPVGIMACNDIRGQQVLNACRAAGVPVPEEIAVVGVDNDEVLCELSDPPLSSVSLDTERIGYEAAALLDQLIAGKTPAQELILVAPAGVVTRRSSDVLAIEDPPISTASRFIGEHACSGIDVSDVLRVVPLSRSTLERRFLRAFGHSPKEEILRVRIARAKQLLGETNLCLDEVAQKVGFEHPEYLSVLFKKRTGMTPGRFRARTLAATRREGSGHNPRPVRARGIHHAARL